MGRRIDRWLGRDQQQTDTYSGQPVQQEETSLLDAVLEETGVGAAVGGSSPEQKRMELDAISNDVTANILKRTWCNPAWLTAMITIIQPKIGANGEFINHDTASIGQQVQYLVALASNGPSPEDLVDLFIDIAEDLMHQRIDPAFVLQDAGLMQPPAYGRRGGAPMGGTFPAGQTTTYGAAAGGYGGGYGPNMGRQPPIQPQQPTQPDPNAAGNGGSGTDAPSG